MSILVLILKNNLVLVKIFESFNFGQNCQKSSILVNIF